MSLTENVRLSPEKLSDLKILIEERIVECREKVKLSKQCLNQSGEELTAYAAQTMRTMATRDMALLRMLSDTLTIYITYNEHLSLSALGAKGLDRLVFPRRRGDREGNS